VLTYRSFSSGLIGLDAHVNKCLQINHCLGILHCDLLNNLDIAHLVMKGIDDLDVLHIRDSVPGVTETFHIVLKSFIMLLHNGLQGFSCTWTLTRTLEVLDEHGT
jgi:hypothetical protein